MIAHTVYTVGHSNRLLPEFITLLQQNTIQTLVDIRTNPYSGRFPHFSQEVFHETMDDNGIVYHWAGRQLGGQRESTNPISHPALRDDSRRGFAEYMETPQFERAIAQLINLASTAKTAIMCAEKHAEYCHRTLISDYLTLKNIRVVHIIDNNQSIEHEMSRSARTESARLIYDRYVNSQLDFH
jgi:uncharacterized protein (DUF488 family)